MTLAVCSGVARGEEGMQPGARRGSGWKVLGDAGYVLLTTVGRGCADAYRSGGWTAGFLARWMRARVRMMGKVKMGLGLGRATGMNRWVLSYSPVNI